MDELIRIFVTWQFIIFCLSISGIVFVVRKTLEYAIFNNPKLPGNPKSKFWTELFLPIFPVIIGGVIGNFAVSYPFPEGLSSSDFGRIGFGIVCGLLSTLVYRVIVGLLKSKIQEENPTNMPPDNYVKDSLLNSVRESIKKDE